MVDEPTRGIDVGARYEINQLLGDLAAAGKAIIVVSTNLPELMGICHRILVFSNSKITGELELERDAFDQERILLLAYQEYTHQRGLAIGMTFVILVAGIDLSGCHRSGADQLVRLATYDLRQAHLRDRQQRRSRASVGS